VLPASPKLISNEKVDDVVVLERRTSLLQMGHDVVVVSVSAKSLPQRFVPSLHVVSGSAKQGHVESVDFVAFAATPNECMPSTTSNIAEDEFHLLQLSLSCTCAFPQAHRSDVHVHFDEKLHVSVVVLVEPFKTSTFLCAEANVTDPLIYLVLIFYSCSRHLTIFLGNFVSIRVDLALVAPHNAMLVYHWDRLVTVYRCAVDMLDTTTESGLEFLQTR
jgi:hypothetical protein